MKILIFFVQLKLEKILKEKRHRIAFDSNDLEIFCRGVKNVFEYVQSFNNNFFFDAKSRTGIFWDIFDGEMKCFREFISFTDYQKLWCRIFNALKDW